MTDKSLSGAVDIFRQALVQLDNFFPHAEIKIVFIPSTLSSYNIVSPNVHYRGFMQGLNVIETTIIEESHTRLCQAIKQIAVNHNFSFVNTTKNLRHAALSDFIHGPLDWDHFNKRGYQVLSDHLAKLFLVKKEGIRMDNCTY